MKKQKLPKGWTEERIMKIIEHYENQSDDEAIAEDEAGFSREATCLVEVDRSMLPAVRRAIAREQAKRKRLKTKAA